jgi:ABC-type Zn uptake system ZnuABC Zn-binding protein ZnuA
LLSSADVILVNGLNLEESLAALLDTVDGEIVAVSAGVPTLEVEEHEEEHLEAEEEHNHEGADPHVWMNPLNVKIWADNIAAALANADPQNAAAYAANAVAYKTQLDELDFWAQEQLATIAPQDRVIVSDHEALAYFADHFGFEVIGALIPSSTTLSEPAAGALADLQQAIDDSGVKAIFIGTSTNPNLAHQVAADTGVDLVVIYTESLSEVEGPAATYLDMMRYNIEAIVQALK